MPTHFENLIDTTNKTNICGFSTSVPSFETRTDQVNLGENFDEQIDSEIDMKIIIAVEKKKKKERPG